MEHGGEDGLPLLVGVVVFKLRPRALEGGRVGEGVGGVGAVAGAGEVEDVVGFVDAADEEIAHVMRGHAEAVALAEDVDAAFGEDRMEGVAPFFEVDGRGAEEDGGSTHALAGLTGGGGGGKRGGAGWQWLSLRTDRKACHSGVILSGVPCGNAARNL